MAQKRTPRVIPLVEYKGTTHYQGTQFEQMRDFKCREDDIWVCSFPRSGTTLTQQTVYLIQTLDFEKATTVRLDDRFPQIEIYIPNTSNDMLRGPQYVDAKPESEPRMIKCHLHYFLLPEELKNGKGKIIYIVRNPKSAITSFYKLLDYINQPPAKSMRDYLELFLTEKNVYACPWGLHVRQYWEHKKDNNVLFLQFENVVKDRHGTVREIAKFLGRELTDEHVDKIVDFTSIESMKTNNTLNLSHFESRYNMKETGSKFINKGEVSGWRKDIPEDLVSKFDEMIEREIGHTDIKFI